MLSRSLSESDLSEIIGGATGSDPPSPIHMMAPSDEDENHTGEQLSFEKLMMAHRCFTIGSWDYYLLICGNILIFRVDKRLSLFIIGVKVGKPDNNQYL